jgi:aspartate aminotransferase-like enzyme
MDIIAYKKSLDKKQTPYTPALPLFFALHEALEVIIEEGMAKSGNLYAANCRLFNLIRRPLLKYPATKGWWQVAAIISASVHKDAHKIGCITSPTHSTPL